jgi:hypothetical protein
MRILNNLILTDIIKTRSVKALMIGYDGNIPLGVDLGSREIDVPLELKRLNYYAQRIRAQRFSTIKQAAPHLRGIINVEKYKRELSEYHRKIFGADTAGQSSV